MVADEAIMTQNRANTAHRAVPRIRLLPAAIIPPTPPDDIELKADRILDKKEEVRQDVRNFSQNQ
tara:strand:+ start:1351 stop:1545 length:195 start_codon:yes stop_codon:yes gene_type:complete